MKRKKWKALLALGLTCLMLTTSSTGFVAEEQADARTEAQDNEKDKEAEKKAAEQKAAEQKAAEQKAAEQRAAEQKAAEQRAAEQKAAEQRAAEQKAAEQRAAEQKAAEQRAAEQRAAEQKAAEQREAEQKAAEQREAEQRAAEQREAEQKAAEQREAEQKAAEQREAEQKAAEQKGPAEVLVGPGQETGDAAQDAGGTDGKETAPEQTPQAEEPAVSEADTQTEEQPEGQPEDQVNEQADVQPDGQDETAIDTQDEAATEAQTVDEAYEEAEEETETAEEALEEQMADNDPNADPNADPDKDDKQEKEMHVTAAVLQLIWDDTDTSNRPSQLSYALYENGTEKTVSTLSAGSSWRAQETVDITLAEGEDPPLTWSNEIVSCYYADDAQYELVENIDASTVTYTWKATITLHAVTAVTSRSVSVVWEDENNKYNMRPKDLALSLNSGQSVTVSAVNGWSASVENLPEYVNGSIYDYEWNEKALKGYDLEITIDDEATTFTYTIITEEKPVSTAKYKLKVRYWIGSKKAADTFVGIYEKGQQYNVKSPRIAGYKPDKARVRGTIKGKTVVNVYYKAQTYQVTVRYQLPDGSEAAAPASVTVTAGEGFSINSPSVAGYRAQTQTVSGVMAGRNLEYVVRYSAEEPAQTQSTEETVEIEAYETPLGLGAVTVNAGDCFE